MRSPFGRARRDRDALLLRFEHGEAIVVACSLRRTSARGWGPWTEAELHLSADPSIESWWHVEDPLAVGLAPGRGPVDVVLAVGAAVWVRPVRFKTEAFHGMDAEIVVIEGERSTVELALPVALVGPVTDRLVALLAVR